MQQGSVIRTSRGRLGCVGVSAVGKDRSGRRTYRKRVIGTVEQYENPAAVRHATSALISRSICGPKRAVSVQLPSINFASTLNSVNLSPGPVYGASRHRRRTGDICVGGSDHAGAPALWTRSRRPKWKPGWAVSTGPGDPEPKSEMFSRFCSTMHADMSYSIGIRSDSVVTAPEEEGRRTC